MLAPELVGALPLRGIAVLMMFRSPRPQDSGRGSVIMMAGNNKTGYTLTGHRVLGWA